MAVRLLANEVSDLCIGKPAVRSLPLSAAAGDLAAATACIAVTGPARAVVGRVGLADVLCFLCAAPEALARPAAALAKPVSALLPKDGAGEVRRVDPRASYLENLDSEWNMRSDSNKWLVPEKGDRSSDSSGHNLLAPERRGDVQITTCIPDRLRDSCVLEALDAVLSGAQVLAVPLRSGGRKKQLGGGGAGDFCWLTQEDIVRYFLNSISVFSHVAARSVSSLGLVRADFLSVRPHEAALSAVPLIRRAIATETTVAVVTGDGHLVGEISPALLAACDETAAAAIATLSVADLMAYIDYFGSPPEHILRAIKTGLKDKGLDAMLELMEDETLSSFSLSSSSSDEETGRGQLSRRPSSGSYGRRSTEEPVVCSPASSLVAVMVQALAHRVSYLWVLDEEDDCRLAGIVTFVDVLRVFREQLQ